MKRVSMKKISLIFVIVGFIAIGSLSLPYIIYADCGNSVWDCCIMKDNFPSNKIATTSFSMCWSWKHAGCRPCHGGGEWGYFATWCNGAYQECQGKCWACCSSVCCYDENGKGNLGCG
ncbi:MAG: hypothetical protein NT178_07200 [Proteobacteria bacterium]|nr:hypothetical protein [Pseudomonadota bacterium]